MSLTIYTADQVAAMLGCAPKTVEEMARAGQLPGIKPGGAWVFPAGALVQRLDELAIEQATQRRNPERPSAVATAGASPGARRRHRPLPKLIDLGRS